MLLRYEQAANKAVAEVAAANRDGKIAAKAREGETRVQSAQVHLDSMCTFPR